MAAKKQSADGGQATRIGLFGASGTGKTTKARELVAGSRRLIIFDPLGEWAAGLGKVKTYTSLHKCMVDVFMAFGAGFRVMYVPTAGREEDELSRLSAFLYDIQGNYHRHQTKITLVADEVHLGFPQPARVVPHGFATLCTRGRHRGINLVGITQRTAQVNPAFRGNLEYAYFFRHGDALDIGKACQQLGAQWRGALQGLKNFECLAQHDGVVNKIICKK